uniref:Rhoptry neck protein RON4 n=1 Tax=Neospora caninum (strain Liverpool) TaxID=572307 RepID=A0A0F7UBI4_NEOCL|nr:TPA: rhoptry neck protein RON4 [Neospora caninum Liverpool]
MAIMKSKFTGSGLLMLLTLAFGTTVQCNEPPSHPQLSQSTDTSATPTIYRSELETTLKVPGGAASQKPLASTGNVSISAESTGTGSETPTSQAEGTSESLQERESQARPTPAPRRSEAQAQGQSPTTAPQSTVSTNTAKGLYPSLDELKANGLYPSLDELKAKGLYPSLDELKENPNVTTPIRPSKGLYPSLDELKDRLRDESETPTSQAEGTSESLQERESQARPTPAPRRSEAQAQGQSPTTAPQSTVSTNTENPNVTTPIRPSKGLYPPLDEYRHYQESEGSTPLPADVTWFSIPVPMGVVDRRETRALKQQFTQFLQQLSANYPKLVQRVYEFLGWPSDKLPENEEQAQMFIDALNTSEALLGKAARWIFNAIPEMERAAIYTSFYQLFRNKLPSSFFEAAGRVNPEVREYWNAEMPITGTWETPSEADKESEAGGETANSRKGQAHLTAQVLQPLPVEGPTPRDRIPWMKIKSAISKAHGPVTRVPEWTPVTGACALGEGYTEIDVAKATTDVLFRLTFVILHQIKRKNSNNGKLEDDQALVALCSTAGAFVDAWQQQQQALAQEDPGTPKAHAVLIERLRHVDKYFMKTYDETTGESDHKQWKKNKTEVAKIGRGAMMKSCVKYMKAAGDVATRSFNAGTTKYPSRSLYGGIANTLETKFTDSEAVAKAVHDYARQHKMPEKLVGLCGALQISGHFKKCFSEAGRLSSVTFFHQHIDGASVLLRTLARDRPIGKHAVAQAICDPSVSAQYFESAFRLFSSAVTQEWEKENLFAQLASWTGKPVILAPSLEDQVPVPPAHAAYESVAVDDPDRIYRIRAGGRQSPPEVLYVGGLHPKVKPTEVHVQGPTVRDNSKRLVHDVHPSEPRGEKAPSGTATTTESSSEDASSASSKSSSAFVDVQAQGKNNYEPGETVDSHLASPRKNEENSASAMPKRSTHSQGTGRTRSVSAEL